MNEVKNALFHFVHFLPIPSFNKGSLLILKEFTFKKLLTMSDELWA